jgi:hypothetical protein
MRCLCQDSSGYPSQAGPRVDVQRRAAVAITSQAWRLSSAGRCVAGWPARAREWAFHAHYGVGVHCAVRCGHSLRSAVCLQPLLDATPSCASPLLLLLLLVPLVATIPHANCSGRRGVPIVDACSPCHKTWCCWRPHVAQCKWCHSRSHSRSTGDKKGHISVIPEL